MSDHLLRHLAPISEAAWRAIDDDAKARLTVQLASRKLVDFSGPAGWEHSAVNVGRCEHVNTQGSVATSRRVVLPLVEMRADFTLSRSELDDVDRGAPDPDLSALETAVHDLALAENRTVFHGFAPAGIIGIAEASSHDPIGLDQEPDRYPSAVARAVDVLRNAGIGGPYGIAIAPGLYTRISETAEHGGYPLFDHLREILGGPVVWAPGIDGGIVSSQRGGDFSFECGQDVSIGYRSHDADDVELYLEESYTFRVIEPDAAIALRA